MDVFGIKNLTNKELEFNYDNYYRNLGLDLQKAKTENDRNTVREVSKKKLDDLLNNIDIDINILKSKFINLILDKNSSKYLWILYSKYENEENYIDKTSNILKSENKIIRGGANIYKMNGWMAHTLYVYQIINNNIAQNVEIFNCNGDVEKREEIKNYTIIFVPDKEDADFAKQFRNGNFFKCIEKMKKLKENICTYENIVIAREISLKEKFLYIRVI